MDERVGGCGLVCRACPAYLATQAGDAQAIARIATEWGEQFHVEVRPEHVWCDGCMTTAPRKCQHTTDCEIRACVVNRGLTSCATCPDYGCDRLSAFFQLAPQAQQTLEQLRAAPR